MNYYRIYTTIGAIWLLLSLLIIPIYLYPLPSQRTESFKAISEKVTDDSYSKNILEGDHKTKESIVKSLKRALWIRWLQDLFSVIIALIASYLLIIRNNIGRIVVILLSAYILYIKFKKIIMTEDYFSKFNFEFYKLFFSNFPLEATLGVLTFWLALISFIFLLLPPPKEKMNENQI